MNETVFEVLEDFERVIIFSDESRFVIAYRIGDLIRTTTPEHKIYKQLVDECKIRLIEC